MPNYSYVCINCKKDFEKWISYNDNPNIIKCPKCKSKNVKKLIYSSPIHFHGSGFYSTDKDN